LKNVIVEQNLVLENERQRYFKFLKIIAPINATHGIDKIMTDVEK